MANKKFSDLDTASTLTGVELFAVSQSGVSKKSLLSAVKSFLDSAVATLTNKTFDTAGAGNVFKINGTTISTNTGTGSNVLATSPTLVTPALGTPSSGVGTNLTGTASGLTAGTVTTNANLTGPITSTGNATSIAAQTGTGSVFVMQASPTLTTPDIGVATGTSLSTTGNHSVTTAGNGLLVKEGTNAKQGTAVLVAGAVVVSNTTVTANSRIFLTSQVDGGTAGFVRVSARTVGTDFTITSSSGSDTSTIAFQIFEPA